MIDIAKLIEVHDHGCVKGISYRWGSKPVRTGFRDTALVLTSDCSGWAQYLLWRQGIEWPEGSVEQHEHVRASGYPPVHYVAAATSQGLFGAFIEPVPNEHAGHVLFLRDGETLECWGGGGVDTRRWNTGVLLREVAACYLLQEG